MKLTKSGINHDKSYVPKQSAHLPLREIWAPKFHPRPPASGWVDEEQPYQPDGCRL
jgi:hypothetical protein